jgi:hypothetical protein
MALRLPGISFRAGPEASLGALERDVANEKAISLGLAGAKVERALEALAACSDEENESALLAAADAVQAYSIQREASGLRDHRQVIAD